ncbi:MAG: fibronectin type III domain-containing protein [Bacteroidales bacterium]|nr:fibronectin type III domain-containing protein [Bacteroidales bacterium]
MKKFVLLALLFAIAMGRLSAQEVIIGTGSSSSYSTAFYPYYEDSWWECLCTPTEVGMQGTITAVSLQRSTSGTLMCQNVNIYIGHRNSGQYSSTSDWTPMSNLTLVYSGTNMNIGGSGTGWETYTLTTPYFYDGTDNLVIVFAKHASDYSTDLEYNYSETSNYSSLYRYLDDDITYSQHPGSSTGSRSFNRPNLKLNISPNPNFCGPVTNLAISDVATDGATVSWTTPSFNPNVYIVDVKKSNQSWNNPNVMNYTVTDTFLTISGLDPSTTYNVRVANDCNDDTSSYVSGSFLTLCAPTSVIPITENFDSYTHTNNPNNGTGSNNLAYCWDATNTGSSYPAYPWVYYGASNANSGNYSLRFYTGSGTNYSDQYAFLPELDLSAISIPSLQLGLNMRRQANNTNFTLVVGVTSGMDVSTFTPIDTLTVSNTTYAYRLVDFGSYSGSGNRVVLKAPKPASGNNRGHVDDIILGMNLCAAPSALTVTEADESSITLSWTENGSAVSWELEYGPVGFTTGSGTTVTVNTNPYTLAGLPDATTYEFQIRANCGSSLSDWNLNRVTGATTCIPISNIPFTEEFSNYTHTDNASSGESNVPICWDTYNTGSSSSNHPYVYYSNNNAYSGSYALRFYTQSGNQYADQYAILPVISNSIPLNTLQISMKARSNSANTPFTLIVGVMTGGPNTFVPMDTLTITGTSYSDYVVYYDAYTGSGNRMALKAPKPGSGNNRGYVDDIVIDYLSSCRMVSGVNVSDITTSEATVSWQAHGSETSWLVEYKANGDSIWESMIATTNPCVISPLNASTTYQVHVAADCGGEFSTPTGNVSFTTPVCDPTDQCLYTFNLTDDYGDGWNSAAIVVRQNGSTVATLTISNSSASTATHQVALCDSAQIQLSWTSGSYDDECSFTVTDPFGEVIFSASAPSSGTLTTFTSSCSAGSCPRPLSISATEIGDTEASISWVSTGTETDWILEYKLASDNIWDVLYVNTNPYLLTGLTAGSVYDIRVKADCGGGDESDYRESSFETAACPFTQQCNYSFSLTDSFGDGWNGASIIVTQNGVTVANLTVPTSSSNFSAVLSLCENMPIQVSWVSGSYDSECSFTFTDPFGEVLLNVSSPTAGVLTSFTSYCTVPTCPRPSSVSVTNISDVEATINWVSSGTETDWIIEYKPSTATTWDVVYASANPYLLTGLTASTIYDVRVYADCGGGDVSDYRQTSFQTSICPITEQCNYTFTLSDSYGDGWNTATLLVKQNGLDVVELTVPTSSYGITQQVPLCDNAPMQLVWNSGNFDTECSFTVSDPYGDIVYSISMPNAGTLTTIMIHCAPPTCPKPSALTVSDIGTATATVSWTPGGSESSWILEYKPSNSSNWTSVTTSTPSYVLTGLSATTAYDVRVQADCGGGDLSDWRETTFNTSMCEATMQCSYTLNVFGDYNDSWDYNTLYVQQNGLTLATITEVGTSYTLPLTLCSGAPASLVFYSEYYSSECSITLYGPDGSLVLMQADMSNFSTYNFTPDCAGAPATCDAPTGLAVNNPGPTSATATWTAGGSETAWNVQYKTTTATSWQNATANTTSYTMSGLTPNTQYQIRVQASCGDDNSDWSNIVSFTTPNQDTPTCPAPTNLSATLDESSHTTVVLTWQQAPNTATEWQVNYRQTTESTWSTATVSATTYTLTDLVPNEDYMVNVVAHCTNGLTSDESNTATFHTDNVGILSYLERSVTLYPNPATETISIAVSDANITITSLEVYNVYGQIVETFHGTSPQERTTINVSSLSGGMYFVRVITDNGVVTKSFVKR